MEVLPWVGLVMMTTRKRKKLNMNGNAQTGFATKPKLQEMISHRFVTDVMFQ
jgi:hypothetical protein